MTPFSALYYITRNKKRTFALIALISTISFCYLGGLYVTNPADAFSGSSAHRKDFYFVGITYEDDKNTQFNAAYEKAHKLNSTGGIMMFNSETYVNYKSLMNFTMDNITPCFSSSEDFVKFNKVLKLMPEDFKLKDGEVIMSGRLAHNAGLSVGDTISKDSGIFSGVKRDYVLTGIYEDNTYSAYMTDNNRYYGSMFMVLRKGSKTSELTDIRSELSADMNSLRNEYPLLYYSNYETSMQDTKEQFHSFNIIFFAVVGMVSLVLGITINATFVGAYDKRKYEFSIYKAIGHSRHNISMKIIKEILSINLFGLLAAVILSFSGVFFLNNLMLLPIGLSLKYFKPESLIAVAACDAVIILPVLLARLHEIRKYDIVEF